MSYRYTYKFILGEYYLPLIPTIIEEIQDMKPFVTWKSIKRGKTVQIHIYYDNDVEKLFGIKQLVDKFEIGIF